MKEETRLKEGRLGEFLTPQDSTWFSLMVQHFCHSIQRVMLPTSLSFLGGVFKFHLEKILFFSLYVFLPFKRVVRIKMYCVCAQSCLTLCNPVDCSPPGSLSMGYFRQEYWSGLPGSSRPWDQTHVSWVSCIAGGSCTTTPPVLCCT